MGSWHDNAGLFRKFGTDKTTVTKSGEYASVGTPTRVVEAHIPLSSLTTSTYILSDVTFFPKNMRVEGVEVLTFTASTTSGSGTPGFNVGITAASRTSAVDADGFIAAMTTSAVDTAGERQYLTAGSTFAGALIGTTTTEAGYLSAILSSTGTIPSGVVKVRVFYTGASS